MFFTPLDRGMERKSRKKNWRKPIWATQHETGDGRHGRKVVKFKTNFPPKKTKYHIFRDDCMCPSNRHTHSTVVTGARAFPVVASCHNRSATFDSIHPHPPPLSPIHIHSTYKTQLCNKIHREKQRKRPHCTPKEDGKWSSKWAEEGGPCVLQ